MNQKPLVVFSHGKESGPSGDKIRALSAIAIKAGFEVESLDYRGLQLKERIDKLKAFVAELDTPFVLVGSSMGGYVSTITAMESTPAGLFLIAPAFYMEGYYVSEIEKIACPVSLVHGWNDDIVPVENAVRFASTAGATLHVFDAGHRLRAFMPELESLFAMFLKRLPVARLTGESGQMVVNQ